jgi:AcrR family transcriptional regulator
VISEPVERAAEDITARARIRDAALGLFAERGIAAATIRDIAAAANVSSGLVRHHFGSKEALRDACDTYAFEEINRLRRQMFDEGRMADQGFMISVHPTLRLLQDYLVRSMMDGSAAAAAMFDESVLIGEDWAQRWIVDAGVEISDLRAYSAVLCAMKLGAFLMGDQISRALGVDVRSAAGQARMTRGFIDIFKHPLLTAEQAAQMHTAVDGWEAQRPGDDESATDPRRGPR